MIKEYQEEVNNLIARMEGAEMFSKELPLFASQILENKHNNTDHYINFGFSYKKIPLAWGIKRFFYDGQSRRVSNAGNINYPIYLFNIYINCLNIFEDDFYDYCKDSFRKLSFDVFYFDEINSTLYVKDEQIETVLEKLNDWYLAQIEKIKEQNKKNKIEKLRKELVNLEND